MLANTHQNNKLKTDPTTTLLKTMEQKLLNKNGPTTPTTLIFKTNEKTKQANPHNKILLIWPKKALQEFGWNLVLQQFLVRENRPSVAKLAMQKKNHEATPIGWTWCIEPHQKSDKKGLLWWENVGWNPNGGCTITTTTKDWSNQKQRPTIPTTKTD